MASVDRIHIAGLEEIKRAFKDLPENLRRGAALEILKKAAVPMRDDARANAPVDKGKLRRNIYLAKARDSTKEQPLVVVRVRRKGKKGNTQNAFYWMFQEFGTRFMTAHPFIRPAYERNKNRSLDIIKNQSAESIAKSARRVARYTARFKTK